MRSRAGMAGCAVCRRASQDGQDRSDVREPAEDSFLHPVFLPELPGVADGAGRVYSPE